MEQFCLAHGFAVDEWITEVGGGMNLTRRKFLNVMDAVDRADIATVVVAHKDRLARFGLDYLNHAAAKNGCEILVVNQESLSPQQEMVEGVTE